jgi:DNA-binding MarR family transcriptional regulator
MVATHPGTGIGADAIARDLFDVLHALGLLEPTRRRPGDLKEVEYLALSLLHERGTVIVGELQKCLGVLPAQMSRIIRALEQRDRPLIVCRINTRDKRKIDVALTAAGAKALQDHVAARIVRIAEAFRDLPEECLEEISRFLDKLRDRLPRNHRAGD